MEDGYHLTADLVDHAIEQVTDLRNADPDKPFFLYVTPGACHSPHQAPPALPRALPGPFRRRMGRVARAVLRPPEGPRACIPATTELSPRPEWVPAWDDLSDDERRVHARYMEAFAAMLTHTDEQIGRLVDFLDATGDLDNTVFMVLSDNGASSEGGVGGSLNDVRHWNGLGTSLRESVERIDEIGGPAIHNNYPWGWTVAGNTPYRRWKREVHEGGVADPLIVHWPAGIADPGTRAPPVLPRHRPRAHRPRPVRHRPTEVARRDPPVPASKGSRLAAVLRDGDHPEVHTVQYFEMFGCRALYRDGYKAVTFQPIQVDEPRPDDERWELYDVRVDPSECHDLAAEHADLLAEMVEEWWRQAEAHHVLPVDNRPFSEFTLSRPRSTPTPTAVVLRPSRGDGPRGQRPRPAQPDPLDRGHVRRGHRGAPPGCWPARARGSRGGCSTATATR